MTPFWNKKNHAIDMKEDHQNVFGGNFKFYTYQNLMHRMALEKFIMWCGKAYFLFFNLELGKNVIELQIFWKY